MFAHRLTLFIVIIEGLTKPDRYSKSPLVSPRHARTRAAAQAQFPNFMYNSLVVCNVPFCKTCNYDANRVKYMGQYSVSEFMPFNLKKYWLVEVGVNRLTAGSGVARVDHRLFKN